VSVNIGVVSFAHIHADGYQKTLISNPDIEVTGFFDSDLGRGKQKADEYNLKFYDDYDKFLHSGLDGVVICSENSLHLTYALPALEAGLHVLCEKPLATTVKDAAEIAECANHNSCILKTAFPTRFSKAAIDLRRLIRQGELGTILTIVGTNHGQNPFGWFNDPELSGGGSIIDHTVHQLDYARWVLEDEPTHVYAEMDTFYNSIQTEDAGIVMIDFSEDVSMTIDASWSRPPQSPSWGDNIMEFHGTEYSAILDTQGERIVRSGSDTPHTQYVSWGADRDAAMVRDFCNAIEGRDSVGADGNDGVAAVATVAAAYRSAKSGRVEAKEQ
jgi:UDP-N-acetylglucosamine 3-dehydrogenase